LVCTHHQQGWALVGFEVTDAAYKATIGGRWTPSAEAE